MNIITKARIIIIIKALTIIKNTNTLVAEFLVKAKILLAEFLVKNITDDVTHHNTHILVSLMGCVGFYLERYQQFFF
jgi:hypothetical protein